MALSHRLLLLCGENQTFSQADREGFMFCSFSNLENENILLTTAGACFFCCIFGWVFFFLLNRSIFYPFMSEARQINGFWNLFPMLISFPKLQERWDGSAVLYPLGKKRSGICSCFVLRAASKGVWINHPSPASVCSQPATQARESFSADANENWPGSALIHGKEPIVLQFAEGTKEFLIIFTLHVLGTK